MILKTGTELCQAKVVLNVVYKAKCITLQVNNSNILVACQLEFSLSIPIQIIFVHHI